MSRSRRRIYFRCCLSIMEPTLLGRLPMFASRLHRGCLPKGGARGEGFALNELPHPCCVLYLNAKVWFFFEIAMALVYCMTAIEVS